MTLTASLPFGRARIELRGGDGVAAVWSMDLPHQGVAVHGCLGPAGLHAFQLLEGAYHLAAFEKLAGVKCREVRLPAMAPLVSVAVGIALAGPGLFDVRPFMQPLADALPLPLAVDEDLRPLSDALIAVRDDVQAEDQLGLDHSLHALRYVLRRLCQDRIGGQG